MGVVNVFLGGSGKYIAEELKGTSLYYGVAMPDFVAFDLDTSASHTGSFGLTVGQELITVDPGFPGFAQEQVAGRWASLDAGRGLPPLDGQAGPRVRPEASVMRRIGSNVRTLPAPTNGLWGVRGPGLLAFASFMDSAGPGRSAALRRNFEEQVRSALQKAAQDGGAVWVNIVASTAGGTGAGMFLPIALWLRQFAREHLGRSDVKIALVLFWWTTFAQEDVTGPVKEEMISKGQSGTYAILRELQLLDFGTQLQEQTVLAQRHYPLWPHLDDERLTYRLNGKPFDRIYWMGLRRGDTTASKIDVYEEGSRLVQMLSNAGITARISAATGQFAQRMVVAVASVDYPRMRVAQRLSGELVEDALELLLGRPDDAAGPEALRDVGANDPNAWEAFVRNEWNNSLSRARAGETAATMETLDALVNSLTADRPLELKVVRNEQRTVGGYALPESQWDQYCISLKRDLELEREQQGVRVRDRCAALVGESVEHFRRWLSDVVLNAKLNPEDSSAAAGARPADGDGGARVASVAAVAQTLKNILQDVRSVQTFVSAEGGISDRVPVSTEWRYRPLSDIRAEIEAQHDRVLRPTLQGAAGLSPGRWALAVIGALGVGGLAYYSLEPFLVGFELWLASVAAGLIFGGGLALALRRRKSLEERRREEEDRLYELYRALIYRQAADALFESVRSTYIPSVRAEQAQAVAQVEQLRSVLGELQSRARVRRTRAAKRSLHSVDQIGFDIELPDHLRPPWVARLAKALRVRPEMSVNSLRLVLRVRGIEPVAGCEADVASLASYVAEQNRGALGMLPGQQDFETVDKTLDDMGTTVLRDFLPATFEEAMKADGADTEEKRTQRMRALLYRLMNRDPQGRLQSAATLDRRAPSIQLNNYDRAYGLLLVPNHAVAGIVNQAMARIDDQAVLDDLRFYLPTDGLTPAPEIGPSVLALTVYPAADMLALPDTGTAGEAYYAAGPQAERAGFMSQRTWNFHILPEAAAAAAIELQDRVVEPLHPLVVARLLGSDPDSGGPSLLELFYTLRSRDLLVAVREGQDSADARTVWRLCFSEPAVLPVDQNDPFGPGRPTINAFDAFSDFMLSRAERLVLGTLSEDARTTQLPHGARIHAEDWSRLGPVEVGELQQAIVDLWYRKADLDAEHDRIVQLARVDAERMVTATGRGVAPRIGVDWRRAVEAVAKAGKSKRQNLTHVNA
jgi:hypothetical protein